MAAKTNLEARTKAARGHSGLAVSTQLIVRKAGVSPTTKPIATVLPARTKAARGHSGLAVSTQSIIRKAGVFPPTKPIATVLPARTKAARGHSGLAVSTQSIVRKAGVSPHLKLASVIYLSLILALLTLPIPTKAAPAGRYYLYVGNYSNGIQAFRYDAGSLSLDSLGMVGEMPRPSFLTVHPNGKFLYAVAELGNDGKTDGFVFSFSIDKATGKLNFLNKQTSGGGGACHLVVDKTGKILLVANYGTGSVADFPLKDDGSIGPLASKIQFDGSGPNPKRQKGAHAHAVVLSADNHFLFVPDLGTDWVRIFKFDAADGKLTANQPAYAAVKSGAGPRHFALAPSGGFAYALDEMGSSVTAFQFDKTSGALNEVEAYSTLPDDFSGENNSAEIQIDPAGKFLYASNRGHNSIAVFAVDSKSGKLNRLEIVPTLGSTPRNFVIDPTGRHLLAANQDSNNIVLFARDPKTGKLTPANKTAGSPSPVCLLFVPAP